MSCFIGSGVPPELKVSAKLLKSVNQAGTLFRRPRRKPKQPISPLFQTSRPKFPNFAKNKKL